MVGNAISALLILIISPYNKVSNYFSCFPVMKETKEDVDDPVMIYSNWKTSSVAHFLIFFCISSILQKKIFYFKLLRLINKESSYTSLELVFCCCCLLLFLFFFNSQVRRLYKFYWDLQICFIIEEKC